MPIRPVTPSQQMIYRQLAHMILYCTMVDPKGSFSVMSDSMPLETETSHDWIRDSTWRLAGDLLLTVDDMAKKGDLNNYPFFGEDSFSQMIGAVKEARKDTFQGLKDMIFHGVSVYRRMQEPDDDSKSDETFLEDHKTLWVILEEFLKVLYQENLSVPAEIEKEIRAASRVHTDLDPALVARFLDIEILKHIARPMRWIKFSLEEDELSGNPLVLVLLAWTMAIVPFTSVFFSELPVSPDVLKNVLTLYHSVKTDHIEREVGMLRGWLAALELTVEL